MKNKFLKNKPDVAKDSKPAKMLAKMLAKTPTKTKKK